MNTISKDVFYEAIKKTYNACVENSKIDSDMAISIYLSEEESYVYAENRLISIKSFFKSKELKNAFSCIVKGKDLLNIIKCMEDDINIELVPKEKKLRIKSGDKEVFLYTNALVKFLSKEDLGFNIEGSCVADLSKIKEIKHNINQNADSRLRSVHLLVDSSGTKVEATNGVNFSIRGKNKGIEFVIEARFLDIISDIAEGEKITINYGKYQNQVEGVLIKTNNSEISLPLEVKKYFQLSEWKFDKDNIPQGMGSVTLDKKELKDNLNLMNTFAEFVQFDIENDKPLIISSIGVYGESNARIASKTKGLWSKISVSFSIKSLLGAINSIEDETITCYLKSKQSGLHIIGDDYYEFLSAVS